MTGRAAIRTGLVIAVLGCVIVGVVISVQSSRALDRRQQHLQQDIDSSHAETQSIRRETRAIQSSITTIDHDAAVAHEDAGSLGLALVRIQQMRADITRTANDLQAARGSESRQTAVLDPLLSCRGALDDAVQSLQIQPPDPALATAALDQGTSDCSTALDLTDGDTGAVHPYDFADPSVMVVDGVYYAFGTNGPAGTVQLLTSTDLTHWRVRSLALQQLPSWATAGDTWAPSVHLIGSTYVMYYGVRMAGSDMECISYATSTAPTGPYVDTSTGPFVCQANLGGSLDPDMYTDQLGFMHLIWRSEGTGSTPAQLWSQYLTGDGTQLLGNPYPMLSADQSWQDGVIENPSMTQVDGTWTLLYSANQWNSGSYTTDYATCTSENGPCTTAADPILLSSTGQIAGPGGADVFTSTGGSSLVAYAAWDAGHVGYPNPRRLHIAVLSVDAGRPTITDRW